jgi:hypothetical protein
LAFQMAMKKLDKMFKMVKKLQKNLKFIHHFVIKLSKLVVQKNMELPNYKMKLLKF